MALKISWYFHPDYFDGISTGISFKAETKRKHTENNQHD